MLFDNPVFGNWYTDTVDIWRMVPVRDGNLDGMERKKINQNPVPCRVYETKKEGPAIGENAARERAVEKLASDLTADIRAGDELYVIRGGNLGHANQGVRYTAGPPARYYDPVGSVSTGLAHQEVGLLRDNIIRR